MSQASGLAEARGLGSSGRDIGFAAGIVFILSVLFLPLPPALVDLGLSFSIALSVLILMVALWIKKPLEFSAFPTILLIATMLRLSLNIATTRLILTEGSNGTDAAGAVIGGFSNIVMGGDFVIGLVVFAILLTVNFLVITKGATRIAEVGARFTLDAVPGKQMAIDADLSAGIIDEQEARRRRSELEEESAFFGAMDGASKFVRGDAIAGLIITAVNIVGGIVIGVLRYDMDPSAAADVFVKLSVGDGLVSQIPALIVSLAAGLLVAKGRTEGAAEVAVFEQLGGYPRALMVAAALMGIVALMPGLPFLPFALLGSGMAYVAYAVPRHRAMLEAEEHERKVEAERQEAIKAKGSVADALEVPEIEVCFGPHIANEMLKEKNELSQRVSKMRRKFAMEYGFVVPDIRLTDDLSLPAKTYEIRIHGTVVAAQELRIGDVLVIIGDTDPPSVPGDEVREPAFGMKALWIPQSYSKEVKREGFMPVDNQSVLLTHLSEVIRNNLAQLLSYKDMRKLFDRQAPEYKRLLDEITPSHISYSGIQAVLKLLLAERISIRNLHLILEAIAEIAPHARRAEQVAEHVRLRMSQQICGEMSQGGVLSILRLGGQWDLAFHQALKRGPDGEIVEFDIDPRLIEDFGQEAAKVIRGWMDKGEKFVLVTAPEARPYVRMVIERLFPSLPVLSNSEVARGIELRTLGTIAK
ncbi:MAG: flagellar biosynthesis protein FlhA [Filomicrobium sp.]